MSKYIKLTVLLAFYLLNKSSHCLPTPEVSLPSLDGTNSPEELLSKIKDADLEKVTDLKLPPEEDVEENEQEPLHVVTSPQKPLQPLLYPEQGQQFERNALVPFFPSTTSFNNLRNVKNMHEQNVLDNLRFSYGLDKISPSSISEELVFLAQPQGKTGRTHFAEEVIPMSEYENDNVQRSFTSEPLDSYDDLLTDEYKNFDESNKLLAPGDYVQLMNSYLNSREQGRRSLDFALNGRSFKGAVDDDMETAESSAAMFRPMFTYRYQKAKKAPPKPPKPPKRRTGSYGSNRRRPSMRYPIHYL